MDAEAGVATGTPQADDEGVAMQGRVTLAQVAQAAGVSRATASLVLNDRRDARFSEQTAQRVHAAARHLGYRPNLLATALANGGTQTIALLSEELSSDPFTADLVRGVSRGAAAADKLLYVVQSDGDDAVRRRLVHQLLDHGVADIIYATSSLRRVTIPAELRGSRLVLLNARPLDDDGVDAASSPSLPPAVPSVVPDDEDAGRRAARLLLEHGRADDVVLVGRVVWHPHAADPGLAGRLRLRGFEAEFAAGGGHLVDHLECEWTPTEARRAVDELLGSRVTPPSAICALNDRVALGVYEALRRHDLRVGADVAVVSFDGSDLAGWLDPPLSSLALPYVAMGERAVELLLDPATSPEEGVVRVPFGPPVRDSLRGPTDI